MENMRIYGPQTALDALLGEFPNVVATPDAACVDHPGEFLGTIAYAPEDAAVNVRLAILGLSCDDFPDWS